MSDGSKIEWTDATWNPITGCKIVSAGCTNCYAMKLAGGRMKNHPSRSRLTEDSKAGPVWNGIVNFNREWLDQPLHWLRPRRIFVCAHGDLFYEGVPPEWVDAVMLIMAKAPRHQFQVLTKRPHIAAAYLNSDRVRRMLRQHGFPEVLPNIILGCSVEDQKSADDRIPDLLNAPAANRFVSYEPALGPIDFTRIAVPDGRPINALFGIQDSPMVENWRRIDWLIAGGESGPGARPTHPEWVRSARDQ